VTRRRGAASGGGLASVPVVVALLTNACTSGDGGVPPASVPIVTPSDVDEPFRYESRAQRQTFESFIACAASHGVDYEGPFTDSTGDALYIRLAPGEHASRSEQEEVNQACPQMDVGTFATRVGPIHVGRFEEAADSFARCIRAQGFRSFPSPRFGAPSDVLSAFWQLPFDWSDAAFVDAVVACVEPLRDYLFTGEPT
jgi:hypothetical protein